MRLLRRGLAGPLSFRAGCSWRDPELGQAVQEVVAPVGFVRYREQVAQSGGALSFRIPPSEARPVPMKLAIRMGCIGAAVLSGRFSQGGVVTSSNAQMCGNKSDWWGFAGVRNADGAIRELAGPGLERECSSLSCGADGERMLPTTSRVTGAHKLPAQALIHTLAPASYTSPGSERSLFLTYENVFRRADELSLPCLAVPALSCGVAGFPAAIGARAALDALENASGGDEAVLTLVEFSLLDARVYASFADAAHERWGRGGGAVRL